MGKILISLLLFLIFLMISCDSNYSKNSYVNAQNEKANNTETVIKEKVKYNVISKFIEKGVSNYDILLLENKKDRKSLLDYAKNVKGDLCPSSKCNLMFYDNKKAALMDREITNIKYSGNLEKYNTMLKKNEKFISDHMLMYIAIDSDEPICCFPFK